MEIGKLYKVNRGNQTETSGIIVKGATADIQVYVSQSLPEALSDMVDASDGATTIDEGSWPLIILPEYIYVTGTADSLEIVGVSLYDLNTTF